MNFNPHFKRGSKPRGNSQLKAWRVSLRSYSLSRTNFFLWLESVNRGRMLLLVTSHNGPISISLLEILPFNFPFVSSVSKSECEWITNMNGDLVTPTNYRQIRKMAHAPFPVFIFIKQRAKLKPSGITSCFFILGWESCSKLRLSCPFPNLAAATPKKGLKLPSGEFFSNHAVLVW